MSEHKEYGDENENYAHHYIFPNLLELLKAKKEENILDLGCGNGSLAKKFIKKDYKNIYGIDASRQGIDIASRNAENQFYVQDLNSQELPLEIQSIPFNIIISTEVIEHLYNPDEFITFCKNILLKNGGGELILSTPYHGYIKNLILSIFNKWDHHHTVHWQGSYTLSLNIFGLFAAVWIWYEINYWSSHPTIKLFEQMGKISYSVYICHAVAVYLIAHSFKPNFGIIIIEIIATFIFSYVFI